MEASGKERAYVDAFYKADENHSDPSLLPFRGRIEAFEPDADEGSIDAKIQGSGYHSIVVIWEDESGNEDRLSPWEVDVIAETPADPNRGKLSEEEKRSIFKALTALKENDQNQVFFEPVDEDRYSDYQNMIEVPMDLSMI